MASTTNSVSTGLTVACSALISFGVVKDHDLSGVSAGIKNWYGVIHNPNKYHGSNCNPYLADVVRHPFIASKLRLTLLDGVEGQCQGGPAPPGGVFRSAGRRAPTCGRRPVGLVVLRQSGARPADLEVTAMPRSSPRPRYGPAWAIRAAQGWRMSPTVGACALAPRRWRPRPRAGSARERHPGPARS
jgi:hypothetical protein